MAIQSIDNALVTEFSDRVHADAQQIRARLRGSTLVKPMSGDIFAYDGLGTVDATELIGRAQPVVFGDIEHKRRKIARRRFVLTLPIDASDVRGALLNPEAEYSMACVRAMERVHDRVIVESLFADVQTGREFDTTVTFANDGGETVDATGGLTYVKLLEIGRRFMDNDVGNDLPEDIVMSITGDEHEALMQETELTSGDFTRQFVVEKGRIVMAAGIRLIPFAAGVANPIIDVSGGVRKNFAMSTRGACLGLSKNMTLKVQERNDLVETDQVQIIFQLGAVRTEGKLVQQVQATP